jgi:hypothetical protein
VEYLGIDVRIILKCISKKLNGRVQVAVTWLRTGSGGFFKQDNETSGSIKCRNF